MYVLTEGWNSGELTDKVEVGGGKCVNGAAVEHRQSLVSGESQVLNKERHRQTNPDLANIHAKLRDYMYRYL